MNVASTRLVLKLFSYIVILETITGHLVYLIYGPFAYSQFLPGPTWTTYPELTIRMHKKI